MNYPLKTLAVLATLLAAQSFAQTPSELAAAKAQFKRDVADCTATHASDDRSTCMREAKNSYAEFRHGKMNENLSTSDFQKNAIQRCEVHQGDDRTDCLARMRGQGRSVGSVAGGGILREMTTRKQGVVTPTMAQSQAQRQMDEKPPSGLMSNCKWVPPSDWVCK